MGNSLFDQLKKVGLVDENKAKQAKTEKYKDRKQQTKGKTDQVDELKRAAQKAQEAEAERNRELNRKRQEEAERKAIAAQIKQIIESSRVAERDGEIAYHFTHGSKVKHIYVSEQIHKQLTAGDLAIATLNGRYEVVPKVTAEKIIQRDPRRIVARVEASKSEASDENDPYAAYKIPDDLMW